jgi:mannose-6-phosphate isomerase-like protein (cupin superfamily)
VWNGADELDRLEPREPTRWPDISSAARQGRVRLSAFGNYLGECPPGSVQPVHRHEGAEQVYVIVTGRGRMIVGKAEQEVSRGTLVFVPPSTDHAIKNEGQEVLTFVSATSPPFGPDDLGPSLRFVRQAG